MSTAYIEGNWRRYLSLAVITAIVGILYLGYYICDSIFSPYRAMKDEAASLTDIFVSTSSESLFNNDLSSLKESARSCFSSREDIASLKIYDSSGNILVTLARRETGRCVESQKKYVADGKSMGSVALTVCERGYLDRFEKTLDMLADSNFENVLDYNISALLRSVEAMVSDVNVVKAIVRESNGTVLASCEHSGPDDGRVTLRRLISKAGVVVGIVELDIREKPAYGWLGLEGIIILVLLVLLGAVGFVLLAFLRRNGMSLWGSFMNRAEASSRGAGGQWTISPAMEEKLKTIIAYIEANYRREISREGLAVMVGVNADNLGRYFKLYAGKRIGDYINDLRIGAAISMLVESDQTISTIAASVGFDCIGTFNRVFKSAMGMSPVEYRMCKGRRRREGFAHFLISIYRRMRSLVYQ